MAAEAGSLSSIGQRKEQPLFTRAHIGKATSPNLHCLHGFHCLLNLHTWLRYMPCCEQSIASDAGMLAAVVMADWESAD